MKAETLLGRDPELKLIQIDKNNKDFSELELLFKNYNKSGLAKPKTVFLAYKQDIENNLEKCEHIVLDLDETHPHVHNYYVLICTKKEVLNRKFNYPSLAIEFIEKHF